MSAYWRTALVAASAGAALLVAGLGHSQQTPATAPPPHSWPAAQWSAPTPPQAPPDSAPAAVRGAYLVTLGDCQGCHNRPGGQPFAGGLGLNTPFGVIYSTNITSDKDTGIGGWTPEQFRRAMREGKDAEGHHLYPAFPYTYFTRASDQDLNDIYAYLMTTKPVHQEDTPNKLPFPLNIRFMVTFWNWLNFKREDFKPDPSKSAQWNRGAYIVNGFGHCGACHTPKTLLGGDKRGQALKGGELDAWFAPDLTGDGRFGLRGWSEDDIVTYLRTGMNAHGEATGSMTDVIEYSTSKMSDGDLHAIATYLKSLDGQAQPAAPRQPDAHAMAAGKAVYQDMCAACHSQDGDGVPGVFPALKGAPEVQQLNPTNPVHVLLAGAQSAAPPGKPTQPAMPSYAWQLTDQQIADVATYVRNSWGNAADPVTAHQVASLRGKVAAHPVRREKGRV